MIQDRQVVERVGTVGLGPGVKRNLQWTVKLEAECFDNGSETGRVGRSESVVLGVQE
jgi:hypothetical protein